MKIILSGMPGKFAVELAKSFPSENLHGLAIGSKRNEGTVWSTEPNRSIKICAASDIADSLTSGERYVALDLSPNALEYIELWSKLSIPVVIGATALDSEKARQRTKQFSGLTLLAPNLSEPLVALQAILRLAAQEFPGAFAGFEWRATESHQSTKKDVSGTARAMLPAFSALGFAGANVDSIRSVRDIETQRAMGIAERDLGGHGWHRYEATRADGIQLALEHRTNGRGMFATGAQRACRFADRMWTDGKRGVTFDMVDVLRARD